MRKKSFVFAVLLTSVLETESFASGSGECSSSRGMPTDFASSSRGTPAFPGLVAHSQEARLGKDRAEQLRDITFFLEDAAAVMPRLPLDIDDAMEAEDARRRLFDWVSYLRRNIHLPRDVQVALGDLPLMRQYAQRLRGYLRPFLEEMELIAKDDRRFLLALLEQLDELSQLDGEMLRASLPGEQQEKQIESEKKTSIKTANHKTRSRAYEDIIDPDMLPSDHIGGITMEVENFDPETGLLTCKFLTQRGYASFLSSTVDIVKADPLFLLGVHEANKESLAPHEIEGSVASALEKLAKTAETDRERLAQKMTRYLDSKAQQKADRDFEQADKKAAELREEAENSKRQKRELEKEWERVLSSYYELMPKLVFSIDTQADEQSLLTLFNQLREMRPNSLAPFIPLLTFLSHRFQQDGYNSLIEDAREIDPYMTYSLLLSFVRFSLSGSWKKLPFLRLVDFQMIISALKASFENDSFASLLHNAVEGSEDPRSTLQEVELDFSDAMKTLDEGIGQTFCLIMSGENEDAIAELVKLRRRLEGFSHIHHHLAVAWALNGDTDKAVELLVRGNRLPEFQLNAVRNLPYVLNLFLPVLKKIFAVEASLDQLPRLSQTRSNLYKSFIYMIRYEYPVNAQRYSDFVRASMESLKNGVEDLPTILLGVRWMSSRIGALGFELQSLAAPLFELMNYTAAISFQMEDLDPFMQEHFKRVGSGDSFQFQVSMPPIVFGAMPEPEELVIGYRGLSPTHSTVGSIARRLTRNLIDMTMNIWLSFNMGKPEGVPDYVDEDRVWLPHEMNYFLSLLRSGLVFGMQRQEDYKRPLEQSIRYLEAYLAEEPRRYVVDDNILNWALFAVFSSSPTRVCSDGLRSLIHSLYGTPQVPPLNPAVGGSWGILRRSSSNTLHAPTPEALWEATRAFDRIIERTEREEPIVVPEDGSDLYTFFQVSQRLFGWQYGETFEEWGARLDDLANTTFIEDYLAITPISFDQPQLDSNSVGFPIHSKESRRLLRGILSFWREFIEKTAQKNEHIASGADEDAEDRSSNSPLDRALLNMAWEDLYKLVQRNEPENFPEFSTLKREQKNELRRIITAKRKHVDEVEELKKYWEALRKSHSEQREQVIATAATLMTNVEYDRSHAYHGIVVETRSMAEDIYRLMLDAAADRMFRSALVRLGPARWVLAGAGEALDLFRGALNPLTGAFHGPETHHTGDAPLGWHYNPRVFTTAGNLANTHLYYIKSDD